MVTRTPPQFRPVVFLPLAALLSVSCASTSSVLPAAELEAARRHAAAVIRDARAEVATLRADLAAARISAAKKEAELRQLRRQVAELRRATEAKEVELLTVRIERDRLLEMRNEAKAKLTELTELRPTGPAPKATQAKLRELESALVALSSEVAEIQKGLVQVRTSAQAKHEAPVVAAQTRRRTVLEPVADAAGRSSEPPFQVLASPVDEELQPIWLMIKRGDTLWRIARRSGLTVRALKEANGLDSDLIRIGQWLVIPATASSQ